MAYNKRCIIVLRKHHKLVLRPLSGETWVNTGLGLGWLSELFGHVMLWKVIAEIKNPRSYLTFRNRGPGNKLGNTTLIYLLQLHGVSQHKTAFR